ncbi:MULTISPECIES: amidohydrolase [Hyphomonas]|uniref:Amidohydrolase n=1 Tax=Hyphomonas adhaerens TaxID=81029 RepID=A0A3B9H3A2_9PROT|nr:MULTISPECIES: amidohydrolase [Hyphomonas]MBB40732.1 amidohydrolase [Hyphomonas sp.]HAE29173.1 amidohydrolase [Hyphomonas adhaerens]|tara:strand:- start:2979 stop:4400 length:1422 start_codon:yes stop_codon:yes gene_type:complete
MTKWNWVALAATAIFLAACGGSGENGEPAIKPFTPNEPFDPDPYPSTYKAYPSAPVLITNATILDGEGAKIEEGSLLLQDGKVSAIGADLEAPEGATVIDASGRWVTPGIIDNHSHLGAYPSPSVSAHQDGNEISGPVTAEVWVEHGIWPQDPGFDRALAGGVTSLQILPGSANLFGGRGITLKNVPARTVQGMKFPAAPYTLKMACGENPKRVYGYGSGTIPGGAPFSRMGNMAGYRAAWIKAAEYKRKWDKYSAEGGEMPARDLELDTLAGVLAGEILVHMHCYRADEMAQIMDLSNEFGYKVTAFHHAVESYKIADKLADYGACSSMWADWWGFKMEAYDGIPENIPMVHNAGACAIVHSDSDIGIQRLNQEAAKSWADGKRVGIDVPIEEAWEWLSLNPAKSLGIDARTGSLKPGKMGDVVIWSGNPFSVYTKADQVFIDGALMYDRADDSVRPVRDFELGQPGEGDMK